MPQSISEALYSRLFFFFFQAEDGIRDRTVTGVQTCALPIFAIVTLGFGEVLRLFLLNEAWLTRGANGVTAIPRPLHAQFTGHYDVFYLVLEIGRASCRERV